MDKYVRMGFKWDVSEEKGERRKDVMITLKK